MAQALTDEEFGVFSFVLAYLLVASLVGAFGLEQVTLVSIARLRGAGRECDMPGLLARILVARAWTLLLVPAGVTALSAGVLGTVPDLLAMFLLSTFLSVLAVLSGILRGADHTLASVAVQELPRGGALLFAAALVHGNPVMTHFWWIALGLLGLFLAISMLVTARAISRLGREAIGNGEQGARGEGTLELPGQVAFMMILIATNLYIWIVPLLLERLSGVGEVGNFNVAMQYPALVSFVSTSLSSLYMSRIPFLQHQGRLQKMRPELVAGSGMVLAIAVPIIALLVLFGEPLLALFGETYRRTYDAMLVIALAHTVAISCGPAGYMLLLTGREKTNLSVMASTNLAGIAVAAGLASQMGHMAAAIGFLAATVLANTFMAGYCIRKLRINPTLTCILWWPKEQQP
ncbi:lipopolysaccharide biosynthesis protein [Stappia sediminis]|nr:hypothetical protein [Stappia sediminis]